MNTTSDSCSLNSNIGNVDEEKSLGMNNDIDILKSNLVDYELKMKESIGLIKKSDFDELMAMMRAPKCVENVFASVIVLLAGIIPDIKVNDDGTVYEAFKSFDNVNGSKRLFLRNKQKMFEYFKECKILIDNNNISNINFIEVRSYINLEEFKYESVTKYNNLAGNLCVWVINIVKYYDTHNEIQNLSKSC
jgi:hypothetical protein